MKTKLLLGFLTLACSFFLYCYMANSFKNVRLNIINKSQETPVQMEIFWNKKEFDKNLFPQGPYFAYKFNVSPGRHSMKIKVGNLEEEVSFLVLPFRHITVEYLGTNTNQKGLFNIRKSFF